MNRSKPVEPNGSVALQDAIQHIRSRDDFVAFVRGLVRDLREKPAEWENADLPSYLEALAAWVEDMEGYYQNVGKPVPAQPDWSTLAEILLAARVYE